MLRLFSITLLFAMVAFLTACEPVYKTDYAYVPPKSSVGNMCISSCIQGRSSCEQMCQMSYDNCVSRARQDAQYQYDVYVSERQREGKEVKRGLQDFDTSYSCSRSCKCLQPFNACYSSCGGKVLERKKCVAFCDKVPPELR